MSLKTLYISTGVIMVILIIGIILSYVLQSPFITVFNFFCFGPALIFFSGGLFFVRWTIKKDERNNEKYELEQLRRKVGRVSS
jgi:Sec-independent protein secretion pathway component TatC